MQNDSTNKNASVTPAFVKNSDGTISITFAQSKVSEILDLFNILNDVTTSDQSANMDLFFDMVEQYTASKPASAIQALKLSAMFTRIISAIGRTNEVIDTTMIKLETALDILDNAEISVVHENTGAGEIDRVVSEYLQNNGIKSLEIINDLVSTFFEANDQDEPGKKVYQCYTPDYVAELVSVTNSMKDFINILNSNALALV